MRARPTGGPSSVGPTHVEQLEPERLHAVEHAVQHRGIRALDADVGDASGDSDVEVVERVAQLLVELTGHRDHDELRAHAGLVPANASNCRPTVTARRFASPLTPAPASWRGSAHSVSTTDAAKPIERPRPATAGARGVLDARTAIGARAGSMPTPRSTGAARSASPDRW